MGNILIILLTELCVCIGAYFFIDRTITEKRIQENQKEWDEYSKGMTDDEKADCYFNWCEQRKIEKGWRFYYFPRQ